MLVLLQWLLVRPAWARLRATVGGMLLYAGIAFVLFLAISAAVRPEILIIDEVLAVPTEEAKVMACRLAREEALFAGTSSMPSITSGSAPICRTISSSRRRPAASPAADSTHTAPSKRSARAASNPLPVPPAIGWPPTKATPAGRPEAASSTGALTLATSVTS